MRTLTISTLMLLAAGCSTVPNATAICDGSVHLRTEHARELVAPGVPDAAVVTGARLIMALDAACDG
jgi:hypothetical protein